MDDSDTMGRGIETREGIFRLPRGERIAAHPAGEDGRSMLASPLPAADPARAAWRAISRTVLTSRLVDLIEETELLPAGKLRHQFSARGHELVQAVLAEELRHGHDGAMGYYRSRPFLLGAGLTVREAFAGSLGRATGRSQGRDVGVVLNLPARSGVTVLPTTGDVGGQFTPVAGWASAIVHRATALREAAWEGAIAVAMAGDGAVATSGFWSALTLATTLSLPMLIVIEDNGVALSTPSRLQTPGGNVAANLRGFCNLRVFDGSGAHPEECRQMIGEAVFHVRARRGPALVRARVPRLCGHSGLDARNACDDGAPDPLAELRAFALRAGHADEAGWTALESTVTREVRAALEQALADSTPRPEAAVHHVFSGARPPPASNAIRPAAGGSSLTVKDAVRLTLERELSRDARLIVLGEDVGARGGVHGVTAGLQERFGPARVVDTSLSEEGIVGRAVGMALAGLRPVPEIQFRKYLDQATEQLNNAGTLRWRTAGAFSAPLVVRIPVGYHARVSDPWHSVSGEVTLARAIGWRVAFPSNAEDAAGLLRAALRGDDPTFFLEHRNLLVSSRSAGADGGPEHVVDFGRARLLRTGKRATVVTWGDMVYRALDAASRFAEGAVEVLDLRTLAPWDREAVISSVKKTGRCLIVHEDTLTAGFGAEIAAVVVQEAFVHLEAPVERLATPDVPIPYDKDSMSALLPSVDAIVARLEAMVAW
jgi:2-oxoisovalerate dehydrogenase E1 component